MSEIPPAGYGAAAPGATAPPYSHRPVVLRGPESLGGLLLILAGIAAAISLILDWLAADAISGWGLLRNGFDDLGSIWNSGLWQPVVVVLGGGVLFLLGLVMWLPARSHRFVGVLGLLVSAAVCAAVLVPLAKAGWDLGFFGPGFWCAMVVAALGLLGSLKAIVTRPRRG